MEYTKYTSGTDSSVWNNTTIRRTAERQAAFPFNAQECSINRISKRGKFRTF